MAAKAIPLSSIRVDGGTQSRAAMDQAVVDDYADHIDSLPPADVYHDGEHYWLADGFYRFHAHAKLERESMACIVHKGTLDHAKWHAAGANKSHGLRRTNEDKAKAVDMALSLADGLSKSDQELADHCGVSAPTVAKHRAKLAPTLKSLKSDNPDGDDGTLEIPKSAEPEKRTGKDGREQSVSSEKRSESAKERHANEKQALRDRLHGPVQQAWDANELTVAQAKKIAELEPVLQVAALKKIREAAAPKRSTQVVTGRTTPQAPSPPRNDKPGGKFAASLKALQKLSRTVNDDAEAAGISIQSNTVRAIHTAITQTNNRILEANRK